MYLRQQRNGIKKILMNGLRNIKRHIKLKKEMIEQMQEEDKHSEMIHRKMMMMMIMIRLN
jgi:hypothetical protein